MVYFTNIESLCCTPEIHIMLYINYTSIENVFNMVYKNNNNNKQLAAIEPKDYSKKPNSTSII